MSKSLQPDKSHQLDKSLQLRINFSQIAEALESKAELIGQDISFSGLSINTRTMQKGDVFIAIKGEHFDAHNFVKQAEENGACGLIVEKKMDCELPQLVVRDTREALGKIALLWRVKFSLAVIAITGSCGKTTVKEMISSIMNVAFNKKGSVLVTLGNLNNDIGVPLTLMRLNAKHKVAVIELGANHRGEIEQLVNMVQPDVALITNAGHAHIEGFGSIEGVAQGKAEIYAGLIKNGIAIINADDDFAEYWRQCNQQAVDESRVKVLLFGLKETADVSAQYHQKEDGVELILNTISGKQSLLLKQFGQHNIYNALAAAAAALSIGCRLLDIKKGLESFTEVSGRFKRKEGLNGSILIDDTYNANPDSVKAGIDALKQIARKQTAKSDIVLILGDMGELGNESKQLHYQLGSDIANLGVKQLFTVGHNTQETHQAYCAQMNLLKKNYTGAMHFVSKKDLLEDIKDKFHAKELVLIKGSRSMAMESIVSAMEVVH